MTNDLSERLTPFQCLSFSLASAFWGQKMLIPEMKYFGDKRVPDEPPL